MRRGYISASASASGGGSGIVNDQGHTLNGVQQCVHGQDQRVALRDVRDLRLVQHL